MSALRMVNLCFLWLVIMVVPMACNSGPSQPTQAPSVSTAPSAEKATLDGATLLDTRCSACHSADRPKKARKTPEEWNKTVTRMVRKGARLTEPEKKVLLDYLAETYKP